MIRRLIRGAFELIVLAALLVGVLYATAVVAPPFSVGIGGGIVTGPGSSIGGQIIIQKVVPDPLSEEETAGA